MAKEGASVLLRLCGLDDEIEAALRLRAEFGCLEALERLLKHSREDLGAAQIDCQNGFDCGRFNHDERYYSPEGRAASIGQLALWVGHEADRGLAVDVFPMGDLDDPDSQLIILD